MDGPGPDDATLVDALRAGEERAFVELVDTYAATMRRVARQFVATDEAADDVVQETFLGVIRGIAGFEGRSSLRTWIFRILVNRARTRGEREGRSRPFSSLVPGPDEPMFDPDRFLAAGTLAGMWASPPSLAPLPEAHVLARELGAELRTAMDQLVPAQRLVLELRDVQGLSAAEVCGLLDVSEGNQRVLLHRARAKMRAVLEAAAADLRNA